MVTIKNFYDAADTITVTHAEQLATQPNVVAYYTTKHAYCPACAAFTDLCGVTGFERQDGQHFKCENCHQINKG